MLKFPQEGVFPIKTPRLFTALLLCLALLVAPGAANPQWQEFTAEDGSFSFAMPDKPVIERKDGTQGGLAYETLSHTATVRSGGYTFIFIALRVRFHPDTKIVADKELRDNAESFAKRLKGKILSQKNIDWTRAQGDTLPAIEVSTETPYGIFRQIYLVEGRNVYGLIAGPPRPENVAAMEQFFGSLKIPKR